MNTVYHWIGLLVFWTCTITAAIEVLLRVFGKIADKTRLAAFILSACREKLERRYNEDLERDANAIAMM